MKPSDIAHKIISRGLMPVFFHPDPVVSESVLKACYNSGLRVFEYTHRGEEAFGNFLKLRKITDKNFPDMALGIGSITNTDLGIKYINAGADFVVAPNYDPYLGRMVTNKDLLWIPGCGTLTEIINARESGAKIIKIFPGNVLGPGFVKSVLGPVPDLKLMPTGGVNTESANLRSWFEAGVVAVGIGSHLFDKRVIKNGEWPQLEESISTILTLISGFKI